MFVWWLPYDWCIEDWVCAHFHQIWEISCHWKAINKLKKKPCVWHTCKLISIVITKKCGSWGKATSQPVIALHWTSRSRNLKTRPLDLSGTSSISSAQSRFFITPGNGLHYGVHMAITAREKVKTPADTHFSFCLVHLYLFISKLTTTLSKLRK